MLAELHHVRAHTFFQPTLWKAPATPGATGGMELAPNSVAGFANKPGFPETRPPSRTTPTTRPPPTATTPTPLPPSTSSGPRPANYNATGKPFFGLFAAQIPHAPFDEIATLPDWDQAYADDPHFASLPKQAQQWAAMVTRIDAHFGNILAALEDPNNDGDPSDSVAANTLVVFQSDNGGPGGTSNTELDCQRRPPRQQGQHLRRRHPRPHRHALAGADHRHLQALQAGTNTDLVIDVTDLLPTFCELAGTEIPAGLDGVSLAPTLLGTGHQRAARVPHPRSRRPRLDHPRQGQARHLPRQGQN